jgi:hypothetical protein
MKLTKEQREKLATLGQRYIKSADPTVNDDSEAGYARWDKWLNQTSGEAYVCTDATAGAAVWQNMSLDADDLAGLFDAKVDKVPGSSLVADTEIAKIHTQDTDQYLDKGGANEVSAAQIAWQSATHDNGNQSGAVTLTPSNGATQKSTITGNVTGLTCALSATYHYLIWEVTTNGDDYTLDLIGYETDGGNAIKLPNTGKAIILLSLSADGTTKYALLSATDVA